MLGQYARKHRAQNLADDRRRHKARYRDLPPARIEIAYHRHAHRHEPRPRQPGEHARGEQARIIRRQRAQRQTERRQPQRDLEHARLAKLIPHRPQNRLRQRKRQRHRRRQQNHAADRRPQIVGERNRQGIERANGYCAGERAQNENEKAQAV